jgi:hypothetical protein
VLPTWGRAAIRLAAAINERHNVTIGAQAGGRVILVLFTDDLSRDYGAYGSLRVTSLEEPRDEPYGTVAVFADAFGNRSDRIQPKASPVP